MTRRKLSRIRRQWNRDRRRYPGRIGRPRFSLERWIQIRRIFNAFDRVATQFNAGD
jgi:hypothetical protein